MLSIHTVKRKKRLQSKKNKLKKKDQNCKYTNTKLLDHASNYAVHINLMSYCKHSETKGAKSVIGVVLFQKILICTIYI